MARQRSQSARWMRTSELCLGALQRHGYKDCRYQLFGPNVCLSTQHSLG